MSYVLEGIVHYISKFMMILFTYFTHMPKLKHDKSPKWIIKFLPNTIKKYCFPFCFNLAGLTPSSKMYMSTYNEMTYDGKKYKTLVYLCVRKNACVRSLSHVKFHNKYTNFLKIMYPKNIYIYIYMCVIIIFPKHIYIWRERRETTTTTYVGIKEGASLWSKPKIGLGSCTMWEVLLPIVKGGPFRISM